MVIEYRERRSHRLRHALAMQSERVYVLVGEEETPFLVPRELLTLNSAVFKAMLQHHFKEGHEGIIRLKDVDKDTFAVVFIWLHQFGCFSIDETIDGELIYGLAIFAEKYQVQRLSNQLLDLEVSCKEQYPLDEGVKKIYKQAPAGSAIRHLAIVRVASHYKDHCNKDDESREKFREAYSGSFTNCADFATDFADSVIFNRIKDEEDKACFYHNHSDIPNAKPPADTKPCPYAKRHALEAFGKDELKYDEELVSHQHQLIKRARKMDEDEQNAKKEGIEEKKEESGKQEKEEMGAKEENEGGEQEDENKGEKKGEEDEEGEKEEKEEEEKVDEDKSSKDAATAGASVAEVN